MTKKQVSYTELIKELMKEAREQPGFDAKKVMASAGSVWKEVKSGAHELYEAKKSVVGGTRKNKKAHKKTRKARKHKKHQKGGKKELKQLLSKLDLCEDCVKKVEENM